ncbi:zinc finger protein 2 homolog [Protopterus annectens]|uniref:zinc finger protein 2 homolog n=1 Tax=Protopterus annectens TaxID=7888 RepID=UPI001CF93CB2|nr:zinc finger protein 2 homolog [Protopterus annectens]
MKLEMPESFEDVAVDFTVEEWKLLSKRDKELHKEVMVQNYEHMVSVGFNIPKRQLLLLIEKQEELVPDSLEGAVTLPQKNSCDEPSSTYKGVQCRKSPRRMSLKKELRNSECVKNFSDQTSAARHELIQMENEFHKCKEYGRSFSQENKQKLHLQTHEVAKFCTNDYCKDTLASSGRCEAHCQMHIRQWPTDETRISNSNSKTCEGINEGTKCKASLAIQKKAGMGRKRHKCSAYDMTFMKIACHSDQEKVQNGEKSYLCGSSFAGKDHVPSYNKIKPVEKVYTCAMCGRHFKKESQLMNHEKLHTRLREVKPKEKTFTCVTCGKSFHLKHSFTAHQLTHIAEKPYTCATCGKSFARKEGLTAHEKIHSGEKPYKCEVCGKFFQWKRCFTVHQLTHVAEKPYACATCGKSFIRKDRLIVHEKIHSGKKPYKCEICGKSFQWKHSLTTHQSSHTGAKPYTCATCGKSFQWKQSFTTHQFSHTGKPKRLGEEKPSEKPYTCSTCGKSFQSKYYCSAHQIIHSGEKPFKCSTCDKRYATKGSLKSHEKIHTGERPYKCATCDKSFKEKTHLTYHEKTHTGEKLYKCDTCDKRFARKDVLRVHEKIHTGEKPHVCPTCGKSFRLKAHLVYHENTHNGWSKLSQII